MKEKIKIYIQELRAPFLTVTIIPVLIGAIFALKENSKFNLENFIFVLFGFIFLHLGTNVLNDYFDYKNGTDNINKEYIPPFTGGSRLIQIGKITPKEVFIEGIILYLLGIIFFIPLIIKFGYIVLIVLIFSLIAGGFYTAPPFKWAHLGLGEFLIFFSFGPLMVLTSYYVQIGYYKLFDILLISLPIGLFAASIIEINQFPDFYADRLTGKKNLLVRLGINKGKYLYFLSIFIAYFIIIICVYLRLISIWSISVIITLPFAIKAIKILFENYKQPKKLTPACGLTIILHLLNGIIVTMGIITN